MRGHVRASFWLQCCSVRCQTSTRPKTRWSGRQTLVQPRASEGKVQRHSGHLRQKAVDVSYLLPASSGS